MFPESQLKIQEKAYQIWEAEGCPENRELDHWVQAEKQINGKISKSKSNRAPQAKKPA